MNLSVKSMRIFKICEGKQIARKEENIFLISCAACRLILEQKWISESNSSKMRKLLLVSFLLSFFFFFGAKIRKRKIPFHFSAISTRKSEISLKLGISLTLFRVTLSDSKLNEMKTKSRIFRRNDRQFLCVVSNLI